MAGIPIQESIDMRGKKITTFILYGALAKLGTMREGEILEIVTDRFEGIESDIKAWCRMTGHKLVGSEQQANSEQYYIEKAAPREGEGSLALIVSSAGLEELLSPLGFALGAALSGTDVHIYFQGPAVRVLKKGFTAKLRGMGRPFSRFARKGMADMGHVPPQDKLTQLRELGAHFYICAPSMDHFGVKKSELIFDDVVVSEYLTFVEVMKQADIQLFPQ